MNASTETQHNVRSAVPVGVTLVVALLAIVAGLIVVGSAVFGSAYTHVPVEVGLPAPARSVHVLPCVEGWSIDGISGCSPAASSEVWPGGQSLPARPDGGLVIETYAYEESGYGTGPSLLAFSPMWAGLIAGGLALLVLVPVLRTTAQGRPFATGNARRFALATVVIVVGWLCATVGPYIAANSIIEQLEATTLSNGVTTYTLPPGWLVADLRVAWWPLPVIALLGSLAAATRRGAQLADDVDGLV